MNFFFQLRASGNTKVAVAQQFATQLLLELDDADRFNKQGASNKHYALAHLLNPTKKGYLLNKFGTLEDVKRELIDTHPTTIEFHQQQEAAERTTQPMSQSLLDTNEDTLNIGFFTSQLDAINEEDYDR